MPVSTWFYQFIEIFFSIAMFVNAALFIPQAVKVYKNKNARSLSLITFAGFNLIQLAVVLHGWIHKDWFLVIGMSLSIITCFSVTVQIVYALLKREKN